MKVGSWEGGCGWVSEKGAAYLALRTPLCLCRLFSTPLDRPAPSPQSALSDLDSHTLVYNDSLLVRAVIGIEIKIKISRDRPEDAPSCE